MKTLAGWLLIAGLALAAGAQAGAAGAPSAEAAAWGKAWRTRNPVWRGLHLAVDTGRQAEQLQAELPRLAAVGVNVLIAEVDYSFDFQSHPELRPAQYVTRAQARALTAAARTNGIRLIPEINCLGHQSWAANTLPLLAKHPEFDETPGQHPGNQGIYCRSWCPQNPAVNECVFALTDELVEAFDADAFHVGMDEVFILASEFCPRCRGGDPARLFARAVNEFHAHLVERNQVEMLMWADRLIGAKATGNSEWEAAINHTEGAVDLIPKDIILCDWHYGKRTEYPSVPYLLGKGFRVWPAAWQPLDAARALNEFAHRQKDPRMLGLLCTVWGKVRIPELAAWPPVVETLPGWR